MSWMLVFVPDTYLCASKASPEPKMAPNEAENQSKIASQVLLMTDKKILYAFSTLFLVMRRTKSMKNSLKLNQISNAKIMLTKGSKILSKPVVNGPENPPK